MNSGANGCDLVHYEVAGVSKLLFWSTNVVCGWLGLETALLEYKLSTRIALPAAGLGNCSFGVQTQYAERSSSGRAWKLLFRSRNSIRGLLF